MAVEKPNRSDTRKDAEAPSSEASGPVGMAQKRRWLLFGSNVTVALILAAALAVAAVWLTSALLHGKARSDWTATGLYSLSPRGKAILKDLDTDVTITMVAARPDPMYYRDQDAFERDLTRYERMITLLRQYELASKRLKFQQLAPTDTAAADAFLQRLQDRFKEQYTNREALLKEFAEFRTQVDTLVAQELEKLSSFGATKPPPPEALVQGLTAAANELMKLSRQAQLKLLSQMLGTDLAEEKAAPTLDEAKDLTNLVATGFKLFPDFYTKRLPQELEKRGIKDFPPGLKEFLESAPKRFEPLQKRAEELRTKFQGPPQKFDEIKESITGRRQSLVFETEADEKAGVKGDVKVVPVDDAWVTPPTREDQQDEPKSIFLGERMISSQLLAMTSKAKPAVFFVTFGAPASGWGGPYTGLAESLRALNFIVQDWDLMRQREMPKVEEWEKEPPKGNEKPKTVLVLVPPPPPNMQRPMPPPSPEAYQPVVDLIQGGTPAILLADVAEMMMRVPYDSLFAKLGVEPRFDAVAVQSIVVDPSRGVERAVPWQTRLTSFGPQPIAQALGGAPVAFVRCVPMMPAAKMPEGVQVTPLVLLPTGTDYWADTSLMEALNEGAKRDPDKDLIPSKEHPVPLAVAVTRKVGDTEQRAVLVGNSLFAWDRIGQFPRDTAFPGNTELFKNSVLWVAGMDNLLAVSPEVLQRHLVGELGQWSVPLRIVLILGLPVVAALLGVLVLVIRRR